MHDIYKVAHPYASKRNALYSTTQVRNKVQIIIIYLRRLKMTRTETASTQHEDYYDFSFPPQKIG